MLFLKDLCLGEAHHGLEWNVWAWHAAANEYMVAAWLRKAAAPRCWLYIGRQNMLFSCGLRHVVIVSLQSSSL